MGIVWLQIGVLAANLVLFVGAVYFTSKQYWSRKTTRRLVALELEVVNLQDLYAECLRSLKKLYGRSSMREARESGTASPSLERLTGEQWKREMRKQLALGGLTHEEKS